jgi:hypothetical protein
MTVATVLESLIRDYDLITHGKSGGSVRERGERLYFCFAEPRSADEKGLYEHHTDNGACKITIYRPGVSPSGSIHHAVALAAASPSAEVELPYLVHELGHHLSNLSGTFVPLSQRDPEASYAEEVRAWAIGERLLVRKGWRSSWYCFKKLERCSLEGYRCGQNLDFEEGSEIEQGVRGQVEQWTFPRTAGDAG